MKTLNQIREASGGKEAYQKFFNSLLKKFGVDSPSELEGKKKKDFFDAIDKGWEGSGEKDEATIHISNEINEKLQAGKGKDSVGTDVDWDNVGDEKKWIKQAKSKYKVTIKKDVGKYHSGAEISGKKADIIKFLQGPMYGGLDDADIEDMWPSLVENKDDFKSDEDESDDKGNYSGVDEASRFSRELRGPAKQIFLKTLEKIKKEKIKGDKDQAAAIDDIDGAQHLNGHDKRTIISALKYESHDDFKDDSDVDDDEGNYSGVNEVKPPKLGDKEEYYRRVDKVDAKFKIGYGKGKRSMSDLSSAELKKYFAARDKALGHDIFDSVQEKAPPGMEDTVKKLKQDHSDEEAFAIAWSIHNKKKNEGTWHLPSDKGVAAKFKKVMSKPITLGKNGEDAIDSIENFIGDDSLFDDLNDAGRKNPKGDARKIITMHMKTLNINPKTFHWAGQESVEVLGEAKKIAVKDFRKVIKIAMKHAGNMQQAIKDIEKVRKGLSDHPDVMDILKTANEDLDLQRTGDAGTSKSVKEGVDVDRRTLGFKAAMMRAEKAKKVREKSKLKKEKKKEQEVLDARYEYDGEVDVVLAAANKRLFGVGEDAAANANASAGVDMAPNAGKKKKDKFKVIKRPNY